MRAVPYRLPVLLLLLSLCLSAADRWLEFRSGPFQVVTDAGEREGRRVMTHCEQLRHVLGQTVGVADLQTVWPVRIAVVKGGRKPTLALQLELRLSRDAYLAVLPAEESLPAEFQSALTQLLVVENTPRLPPEVDEGLASLFSTLEVEGTRVRLGAAPATRSVAWARVHLLATDPRYAGKLRVFLGNAGQGVDLETASRNAFETPWAEIEKQAAAHVDEPVTAVAASGKPIRPEGQFVPKPWPAREVNLLVADLTRDYAAGAAQEPGAPEWQDGLVLTAKDEAPVTAAIAKALERNTANARVLVEAAQRREAEARALLVKAVQANPRWWVPPARLSALETSPARQAAHLKMATQLNPRNVALWEQYATALQAAGQFADAKRALLAAERAAPDEAARERLRAGRREADERRLDQEAAEKRRQALEKERELQKLRDEAMTRIRAAEAKANRAAGPAPDKVVEMDWTAEESRASVAKGTLVRVDCGAVTRLVVRTEAQKTAVFTVPNRTKLAVFGGQNGTIACGTQRPARAVTIEYRPQGAEALRVEFR